MKKAARAAWAAWASWAVSETVDRSSGVRVHASVMRSNFRCRRVSCRRQHAVKLLDSAYTVAPKTGYLQCLPTIV